MSMLGDGTLSKVEVFNILVTLVHQRPVHFRLILLNLFDITGQRVIKEKRGSQIIELKIIQMLQMLLRTLFN